MFKLMLVQAGGAAADASQPPEHPWADAGPATRPVAPRRDSPAKQARPAFSGLLDQQFAALPRATDPARADAAEAAADPSSDAGAAAAGDFTFDVVSPLRAARGGARRAGHADEVLPSFLQRAVAAAAPAQPEAAEPEAAEPEDAEPPPTAPTQDSPLKVRLLEQPAAAASPDGGRGQGGIVALPPVSQLDLSVLDSLPLVTRRELELAYGASWQLSDITQCAISYLQVVLVNMASKAGKILPCLPHLAVQASTTGTSSQHARPRSRPSRAGRRARDSPCHLLHLLHLPWGERAAAAVSCLADDVDIRHAASPNILAERRC